MKQMIFMVLTIVCSIYGVVIAPIFGIFPYYIFSILQPQFLWKWALSDYDYRWSLIASGIAFLALFLHLPMIISKMRWNSVATLMAGYGLLMLMSCVMAHDTGLAMQWGTTYFKIIIMSLIVVLMLNEFKYVKYFAWLLFGCVGYLAWHFNSLYYFDGRLDIFHVGLGAFDNNGISLVIALGLPFSYAMIRTQKKMAWKICSIAVAIAMIHCIMLTYSRATMLSVMVGICFILWCHRPRVHGVVWGLAFVICVGFLAGKEVRDEFFSIGDYKQDASAQSRFDSWDAALDMMWDHPLTGTGVRNSTKFSENYGADRMGRAIHSQFLQIAADSGIPALLAYLGVCIVSITSLQKARVYLIKRHGLYMEEWQSQNTHKGKRLVKNDMVNHKLLNKMNECADMEQYVQAYQAGMFIFLANAFFLSLGVFEIQWLLFAVSGVSYPLALKQFPMKTVSVDRKHQRRRKHDRTKSKLQISHP